MSTTDLIDRLIDATDGTAAAAAELKTCPTRDRAELLVHRLQAEADLARRVFVALTMEVAA